MIQFVGVGLVAGCVQLASVSNRNLDFFGFQLVKQNAVQMEFVGNIVVFECLCLNWRSIRVFNKLVVWLEEVSVGVKSASSLPFRRL